MYCLEKFQRELAYFLDIDLRDLPKVQEILKAQGYTAVKKNDEIIELGSARQSFLEKIPADIAPSTFTKKEIEKLLTQFDNIENLTQHLNTRADSQARQELFHLLESTKNNPNIHYTKDSKDKYLKRFKDNDEHDPYFYLLITKDKDKTFITHLKTRDLNYLEKEILNAESIIKGADIIGDFRQQAGSAKHKSPTSTIDSTTNNLKWQQDGNVLRSVVELDNGEKLLLSKDRLENVYIQSNHIEQVNSYDELILQESLEKFAKDEIENKLAKQIESISQFGENYPQFYHKAHEAIQHLLHTKSGQVQGAFYRDEIGDITLAWGEKGTGKSDGWGLAKIVEYHPEVLDKLDELVQNLPIVKENANRYQLENDMYKLSIRKDFEGQKENWILTAFEKDESIARRRTDLPSSQSEAEKTTSANATDIIPQKSSKATSQISKEIKDIIDSSPQKGRDMQIIGEANFTPQVVEYAHKNNKKVAIDKLSQAEAEQLGYKYPNDVRVTIDYSAINHTLNRHGAESALVKNSGQKAVDYTDIAEYRNIVKGADESLDSVDNMGTPVVVSYKQINGHFVVVEEIRKGQNELNFKTMFKQEGNYKDSESYKKTSQSSNATEGYEPTANSFALTKKGYKPDLPTPNTIIPQMPKDNSDPAKTFQYFKDDFVKAYPKALEYFEGHEPSAIYLSHFAKEKIQEANEALHNTAKDEFSRILKDIGFKQSEINQVLDLTNIYDVEYSLSKVREYLDYAKKHYDTLPQDQQTLAKDLLKHKQDILNIYESKIPQYKELENKRILMGGFHNNAKVLGSDEHQMLKGIIDEFCKPQTIKDSIQDNPQLSALQTKIQQSRQQIAKSKNPDKEYLHHAFKPDEIIQLEKQYFNQAMPQEYKELIQDFPRLYEQHLANELKAYVKDTDTIQEVTTQLLNDFKDKPFKDTAKHAELLLFNTLRDKAQELGFKELDINTPSFKVAFGKFQAKLKKGDIQDLSEHIAINSLRKNRLRIEQSLNIKPLAEFGTNYAEHYHSGESAIAKLLNEKQGQVSGAFYRKELGDIDLVWGDSNFGLKHILDKHGSEFKDIAKELDEIIQNGEVVKTHNGYNITLGDYKVGLNIGWNENGVKIGENKWVVTAFDNSKMQSEKQGSNSASFTKGETLPLNSSDIIPQQKIKFAMEKFNYDEKKAKDLLEWHKDSSPLTKDENGLPKVFYHGTRESIGNKEILTPKHTDDTGQNYPAIFFSSSHNVALSYTKELPNSDNGIYKVFLNAKNPLVIDFQGKDFVDRSELADKIYKGEQYFDLAIRKALDEAKESGKPFDSVIYKNVRDERYGRSKEISDTIAIFNPNQIKHIDNKGVDGKFFNESSPNIYQSNAHIGSGLVGGSVAGIETDENGNITFSPEKFALGFLGGAAGSKAVMSGKYAIMRRMEARNKDKKLYNVFKAIDSSAKYGSKMNLVGKENLNADTLAYALAKNKRFAINKLDEKTAKALGFKYPQDVRRTIQPDEIIHTLTRHGENSDLARLSGQKPVTLDEIAKYQDYADNAQVKQESKDKSNNRVLISVGQLDNGFLVVIEQIRKGQNELGYKNMYFEKGILNDETLTRIFKK